MHTFPDLNSISSLVVVVVFVYWVLFTGRPGSGFGDQGCKIPFSGGDGEGVLIDGKICCLIFEEEMTPPEKKRWKILIASKCL